MRAMDLFEAFDLRPGAIVAAVGGGGKTSLVYALGYEAAARGLCAVVTTTTKFTRPPGLPMPAIIETTDMRAADDIGDAAAAGKVFVVSTGTGTRDRLLGVLPETIGALATLGLGLITVEADGSAHRPFKAPGEHEPVIPSPATDVIVCVGLHVLGQPLNEQWVHRPGIVAELSEVPLGAPVTTDVIVRTLLHASGGLKAVPPGARVHALLNNPPTPEHETLAAHIAERLVYGGYHRAVVATAHIPGDIRAVVK
jgi:probable selenium-dependent hydroxylase accessory protein YqeC